MADREIVIPISKIKTKDNDKLLEELKEEAGFEVTKLKKDVKNSEEEVGHGMKMTADGNVAVKFPRFVQLIATHDFDYIMSEYKNEEVEITSELLLDLANAPEEAAESRFSWLFMGLVLGVITAAIVFLFFVN